MVNKIYEKIKKFIKDNRSFLSTILVILLLFYVELPFVIYKKGGLINLSDRVVTKLENDSDGSFNMTYVTVVKGAPIYILLSYIIPDWDLKSIKEEFGEDYQESLRKSKESMNDGIDHAIIAAFKESNYNITINKTRILVDGIVKEANTTLEDGDEIKKINDIEVNTKEEIQKILNSLNEDETITIDVINNKKEYQRTAKLLKVDNELKMGIIIKYDYDYETEIPVSVKMKDKESGSSGGLMMALSIYDSLTEKDITKGKKIAGTGTIDENGNVGEIAGVKYKVLGASKNHANIFLVPENNYQEAMEIKEKRNLNIEIVKVKTLKEALNYLDNI